MLMGKGKWLIIIIILGLLTGGGYFAYRQFLAPKVINPVANVQPTPLSAEELVEWIDQSEFSIKYPKSLKLDPHEEDQVNYAHLELTAAEKQGNLIVWVKDTNAEDIEDWIKKEKITSAIDSTLGGEPAKKVLSNETDQKLTLTTIRGGYLYQIEVNDKGENYWNKIFEIIAPSFTFVSPTKEKTESSGGGSAVVEEEWTGDEEVIE